MTEPKKPPVSTGVYHSLFWVCLGVAGYIASSVVGRALYFGGFDPVPLRANPRLLSVSLISIPVAIFLLWAGYRQFNGYSRIWVIPGIFATVLALGTLSASLAPGTGSLVGRDVLQVQDARPRETLFAVPVYFDNSRDALMPDEIRRISDSLAVFRQCEAGTLFIRGFASSAPFLPNPSKSDEYNRQLANRRATTVKVLLEKSSGIVAQAKEWNTYEDMIQERRLRDVGLNGERLLNVERLNRRVEVFWSDSKCVYSPIR